MNIGIIFNGVYHSNSINKKNIKNNKSLQEKPGTTRSRKELLDRFREANTLTKFQSDQAKSSCENRIQQKIKAGAKLTISEMNYLRQTNPELYMRVERIQIRRDMLEQKLKNCKSKKEVEDTLTFEIGSVHEKDPDRESLINAFHNVTKEFKETMQYKQLPAVLEEDEKNSNSENISYLTFDRKA